MSEIPLRWHLDEPPGAVGPRASGPRLNVGDWIEVMPVAEHERMLAALRRLTAWADHYDGDIGGALTQVLDGDLSLWEEPERP